MIELMTLFAARCTRKLANGGRSEIEAVFRPEYRFHISSPPQPHEHAAVAEAGLGSDNSIATDPANRIEGPR